MSCVCPVTAEFTLRQDITRLQSYREAGLRLLRLGRMYDFMNTRRQCSRQQRHLLTDMLSSLQVCEVSEVTCHDHTAVVPF